MNFNSICFWPIDHYRSLGTEFSATTSSLAILLYSSLLTDVRICCSASPSILNRSCVSVSMMDLSVIIPTAFNCNYVV